MMYGEPDAAAAMGIPPRRPAGPGADLRVQGLERRRRRGVERDHVRRRRARRAAVRDDRPRGVLRLPGDPPADQAGRRPTPARSSGPRSSSTRRACPRAPRDLVLLVGHEPSLRWRTFSKVIVELAEALGTQLVVTLGALLADVPHTRPCRSPGWPPTPAWSRASGSRPRPTRGRPGSSASSTPPARRPGCRRRACGRPCRTTSPPPRTRRRRWRWCASSRAWSASRSTPPSSRSATADYERQVNLAVQSDPDVQAFVERLEQAAGERAGDEPGSLPSGETIARDLQRFLRQRGDEDRRHPGLSAS